MPRLADEIKRRLSMDDVVRFYGYKPNRGGYICCPFHAERTPSMKIYTEPGRGYACYGCNSSGSVIDFTMHLFNIPFSAACVRLNADFRLGLSSDKPDPAETARWRRERDERERKRLAFEIEYQIKTLQYRRLWAAYMAGPDADGYAEACNKLPNLDMWFEENGWRDASG